MRSEERRVGKERIDEIENPELAQERMKEIYSAKGYPKDWIDKRLRGIAIRQNLTDECSFRNLCRKNSKISFFFNASFFPFIS